MEKERQRRGQNKLPFETDEKSAPRRGENGEGRTNRNSHLGLSVLVGGEKGRKMKV